MSPRTLPSLVSILLLIVVLLPIRQHFREDPQDDFPLSYYPMFSHKRGETYTVRYFVGMDSLGNRYHLDYKLAGTGGFNQVRRQIRRKARNGDSEELLKRVVKRARKKDGKPYEDLTEIYFMKGRFHMDNFFLLDQKEPVREKVLAHQMMNS